MEVSLESRAVERNHPGRGAEVPRVVDESRDLGLLDQTPSSDSANAYSIAGRRPVIVMNRSSPSRGVRSSIDAGIVARTSNATQPTRSNASWTSGR